MAVKVNRSRNFRLFLKLFNNSLKLVLKKKIYIYIYINVNHCIFCICEI